MTSHSSFLKGFISLGLATWLVSEDDGCSFVCWTISLAAQVGAERGEGPECVRICSEAGLELIPFCCRQDGISIPGRRKVFMTVTAAASHDLEACAWSLPALSERWDLLNPPTPPGSFLYLAVCPCLAAATPQLLPWRSHGSSWVIRPGKRGRARCKLHGGLPSLR